MPEAIGHAQCGHCGKQVAVKINRSHLAYYHCDYCAFKGQHFSSRSSESFVSKLKPLEDRPVPKPDPVAANVAKPKPDPADVLPAAKKAGLWDSLKG